MVICFNFLSGKSRYHAVESGVTSLIPAVGNSWFKTRIFPSLLLTAIFDGRFFWLCPSYLLRISATSTRWRTLTRREPIHGGSAAEGQLSAT